MRVIKIDAMGATEIDMDFDAFTDDSGISWDCHSLDDDNDIWVDDEGLLAPGAGVARIGQAGRVPLPAFVVGIDGEACMDTILSLATVEAMTTWTMTEPRSA